MPSEVSLAACSLQGYTLTELAWHPAGVQQSSATIPCSRMWVLSILSLLRHNDKHSECRWRQRIEPSPACRLLDNPDRVDIRCVECILDGSPSVKQLRLNDHVQFDVYTCFTPQQAGVPLSCCKKSEHASTSTSSSCRVHCREHSDADFRGLAAHLEDDKNLLQAGTSRQRSPASRTSMC